MVPSAGCIDVQIFWRHVPIGIRPDQFFHDCIENGIGKEKYLPFPAAQAYRLDILFADLCPYDPCIVCITIPTGEEYGVYVNATTESALAGGASLFIGTTSG